MCSQRSICSPLFTIFIANLPLNVSHPRIMYADNTISSIVSNSLYVLHPCMETALRAL